MPNIQTCDRTGKVRRLLLHTCCGPCATHCVEAVRHLGFEPTLFFANSNLSHPAEYARRRESFERLAREMETAAVIPPYDHSAWLDAVAGLESEPEGGRRCLACFRHNLGQTAAYARDNGFAVFATTLTVSPHKHGASVFQAGREAEQAHAAPDVPLCFQPLDFKKGGGFLRSVERSRAYGLYRQTYCGCEFSQRAARSGADA